MAHAERLVDSPRGEVIGMKDFDDFHGLDQDELMALMAEAARDTGADIEGNDIRLDRDKLVPFCLSLCKLVSEGTVACYHEWVNSD